MESPSEKVRPDMVRRIARWWEGQLSAQESISLTAQQADLAQIVREFGCSAEEALRGACVGEQRFWAGGE